MCWRQRLPLPSAGRVAGAGPPQRVSVHHPGCYMRTAARLCSGDAPALSGDTAAESEGSCTEGGTRSKLENSYLYSVMCLSWRQYPSVQPLDTYIQIPWCPLVDHRRYLIWWSTLQSAVRTRNDQTLPNICPLCTALRHDARLNLLQCWDASARPVHGPSCLRQRVRQRCDPVELSPSFQQAHLATMQSQGMQESAVP